MIIERRDDDKKSRDGKTNSKHPKGMLFTISQTFIFNLLSSYFIVTLPEWLTGSPAIYMSERLHIVRECSNRSGDVFFHQKKMYFLSFAPHCFEKSYRY